MSAEHIFKVRTGAKFRVRGDLDNPRSVVETLVDGKWQRVSATPMSLLGDAELGAKEVPMAVHGRHQKH